jgi:uncharacterized membrane protein
VNLNWSREPAVWVSLVAAILALLVVFGVPVTESQTNAIIDLVTVILAIIGGGAVIRSQVTPTASARLKSGTVVTSIESGQTITVP